MRQSLGEAGPHQVFRKRGSDKTFPMLSNIFIFILRREPKVITFETPVPKGENERPSYRNVLMKHFASRSARTGELSYLSILAQKLHN